MADTLHGSLLVLTRGWRFGRALASRFSADNCLVHAAALTYSTLLSIVPVLALMFAVLKGLGVQSRLEPLLLSRLSLSHDVTAQILTYIDRTNVGALGIVGALALVWTVLSVLSGIEQSFNHIWRVSRGRTWWRQVTDYGGTVMLTPFLLFAGTLLTSSLHVQAFLDWAVHTGHAGSLVLLLLRLMPFFLNAVALTILYAVMPNRRPDLLAIVIGGVVAGCIWQMVQWAYVVFQIGAAQYNAIYGALAQLPLTLVWLYLSWSVVLAGAELAALWEFGTEARGATAAPVWLLALALLVRAAERFRTPGTPLPPILQLARSWHVDPACLTAVADRLCRAGLLAPVRDADDTYVLTRAPEDIDLAPLIDGLDARVAVPNADVALHDLLLRLRAARRDALHGLTLATLLRHPHS